MGLSTTVSQLGGVYTTCGLKGVEPIPLLEAHELLHREEPILLLAYAQH